MTFCFDGQTSLSHKEILYVKVKKKTDLWHNMTLFLSSMETRIHIHIHKLHTRAYVLKNVLSAESVTQSSSA